ncbi:MAG: DUF2461 domain-containing protein [Gemmatimonadota bacterium]|nr:DUF2461 domain-containing protein [Gemmatimonadota bacterium]
MRRDDSLGSAPQPFGRGAFAFLRALERNNEKPWFVAHRDEFEREIKTPLVGLVEEMDARLATVAPELIGDPKRSLFRIHRDVRFSRDKSPYHTYGACWFFHRHLNRGAKGDVAHGGAGFYFHFSPKHSSIGGGIWMPPPHTLKVLRERIAEAPEEFASLVTRPALRRRFGALNEVAMLTRPPRGIAPDHPAAKWLRYKSFTLGRTLTQREVTSPALADNLIKDFAPLVPFVRWLNGVMGLRAHSRR